MQVTAVFESHSLRHFFCCRHSRLATTTTRTKYYDVAYAPYGEDYNGSGTTPDLAFTDQNQDTVKNGWSTKVRPVRAVASSSLSNASAAA